MKKHVAGILLAVVSPLASAAGLAPGEAKGTFTMNGQATPITHAYAIAEPDSSDKSKENVRVILSNVPLSPKAVESWSDRMGMSDLKAVEIVFNPAGEIISGEFRHPVKSFSATGMHEFTKEKMDAGAIAGRLKMSKTDDFFGTKYTYDVAFNAAVVHKAKPAPPNPAAAAAAEKSPQAKAYRAYEKSLRAGDLAAIKKGLSAERAKQMDAEPKAKEMIGLVQMMMPKEIKILDVKPEGASAATLLVSGPSAMDGKPTSGEVKMKLEGGAWKVDTESWKGGE
jgi:hypothetical protein